MISETTHETYLARAVELAAHNVDFGGGPFGAVIVKDGAVVAEGANRVTINLDPTSHAEIVAIRAACLALDSFQLDGCDVYCSCEPCPMCLGALYWARPRAVYYAATHVDAAEAGFDDRFIYEEIGRHPNERTLLMTHLPVSGADGPFDRWRDAAERTAY